MDYHTILPEDLIRHPVPAALKKCCISFLTANYFENKACQLLRQTWADPEVNFYIQFTYINIRSACSLIATPARDNIAASLIYLLKGNIAVREQSSGNSLPRMEGDFYLRRVEKRDCRFTLDFGQPGTYQIVYISLSEKKLEALRQSEPLFQNKDLLQAKDIRQAGTKIKAMVLKMQNRQKKANKPNRQAFGRYLIRRTQKLFDDFIHLYDTNSIAWSELKPGKRIDQLQVYIQNNLKTNLRIATLAKMLLMSEEGFRTFFRRETGTSFTIYVKKARIRKACRELTFYPGKKLVDIALETGYESVNGFYKAFKEVMHCNPEEYRQRQQNPPMRL